MGMCNKDGIEFTRLNVASFLQRFSQPLAGLEVLTRRIAVDSRTNVRTIRHVHLYVKGLRP